MDHRFGLVTEDLGALKGRLSKGEQRKADNDHAGMLDLIDVLRNWNPEIDGLATPNRVSTKSPFGKERTRNLLAKLLHSGEVDRKPITVRGNETHEYSLSEDTDF